MTSGIQQKGMDLLAERATALLDFISKTAPGFLIEKAKNGELILNKGLPEYLEANYSKCETIRTLLKRDSPTFLDIVYQEHTFRSDQDSRSETNLRKSIGLELERTIVSGGAGSGKSVFLKRLFIKSIEEGATYYPIFFEFRSIPNNSQKKLLDHIFYSVSEYAPSFTKSQLNFGLRHGLFYLMLDALDEAPVDAREALIAEIDKISKKFPKCPLVITSRPSDEFPSWEGFRTAHMQPFTLEQCRSFIQKVDYPTDKKEEFLEFITKQNFQKHSAFLSNPLLASMMLLTFEEYGDIPERKHVFYDKCFQVLLREHDASKGRFRRRYCSGLSHDELENVFTFFCVFSYLKRKYNFQQSDLEATVSEAVEASGLASDVSQVIEDFVDAISILQRDGHYYEFTHRSFQEYFYARFAVRDRDIPLVDKIDEIRETNISDGAIRMIADMDKTYFERDFLLPIAKKLLKKTDGVDHEKAPDRLIGNFWARVILRKKRITKDQINSSDDKLQIVYVTAHDDEEYPQRKLNLLLLKSTFEYNLATENIEQKSNLSDAEKLRVFGLSQLPDAPYNPRDISKLKINHQNRHKLVTLQSGSYAAELNMRLCSLVERLDKDIFTKTSKLATMIKRGKS